MKKMKDHAEKFEAKTYFARVGLGRGDDYKEAIVKDEEYTVIYNGLQEI